LPSKIHMRQLRGQRYSPDCQRTANVIHTSADTKKLDNVLWSAMSCGQENRRVACVCQSSAEDKFRLVQTWRHHKGYIGQSHGYLPPRRRINQPHVGFIKSLCALETQMFSYTQIAIPFQLSSASLLQSSASLKLSRYCKHARLR